MTIKNSLKLTAVGVGIASLAFVGCNNKSNDNKTPASDAKAGETTPQKAKNLKVKFKSKIPLDGCAEYQITMFDQDGKQIEVKESTNISVALIGDTKNKFYLDENGSVCANTIDTFVVSQSQMPVKGDEATISVIAPFSEGLITSATTIVTDASPVKKVGEIEVVNTVKVKDIAGNDTSLSAPISIAQGDTSSEVTITAKYEDGTGVDNLKVEISDDKANKLVVTPSETKGKYTFKLAKDATVGTKLSYKVVVNKFVKTFEVEVTAAKIEKLELVQQGSTKESNVLVKDIVSEYDLIAHFTNGTVQNLTTDKNSKAIIKSIDSESADIVALNVPSPTLAKDHKIRLTPAALTAEKPAIIKFTFISAFPTNKEANLPIHEVKIPLYVGQKPTLINKFTNTLTDQATTVVTGDEKTPIAIPVGGELLKNNDNGCAKLAAYYKLGDAAETAIADAAVKTTFGKIVLSNTTDFEHKEANGSFFVCAKSSAKLGASTQASLRLESDKELVSKPVTITASAAVETKFFVLNSKNTKERLNLELNDNNMSHVFDFRTVKTDHSISSNSLNSNFFTVTVDAAFQKYFEVTEDNTTQKATLTVKKDAVKDVALNTSFATGLKVVGKGNYELLDDQIDKKGEFKNVSVKFTKTTAPAVKAN